MKDLHIICGKCGSNVMLEFRIDPTGNCDNDGVEYPAVFITCNNCSNLSSLDDTINEKGKGK